MPRPDQHGYQGDPRVADLAEALRNHAPNDQREALSREIVLSELERLDRPFDQSVDPTHVTASAIVVGARGVILHRHRRLHRWLQPGGHIEAGESPASAAVRECTEETGLVVAHPSGGPVLVHVDVHEANGHVHLDIRYLVSAPDQDPDPGPGESQEVAWFSWEAADSLADAALAGALRAARRLSRVPDPAGADTAGSDPAGGGPVAEPLDTLMQVQQHDTTLDQLRHRMATLPERAELAEVDRRRAALETALAGVQSQVDELAGRQKALEATIATTAARRHELEQRMLSGEVSASRDLQAMDQEVRHLGTRQSELEEEDIALLEEEEPLDALVAEHRTASASLSEQAERLTAAIGQAEEELHIEIAAEEARREAIASGLPDELAQRYELLRARLGGIGAAPLVGERCGGCHLTLSSVDLERIRRLPPDEIATCPECDRLLAH